MTDTTHRPATDPRGSLAFQAGTLASGTVATLTGLRKYSQIDDARRAFVEFCEENEGRYDSWIPAWAHFEALHEHDFTRYTEGGALCL